MTKAPASLKKKVCSFSFNREALGQVWLFNKKKFKDSSCQDHKH